ncbi:MAG: DNA polymerase III subunit delta [Clostridia bacterium]|nr:DNA polymerase III subunit delta [Clostridia bacterium]
MAVLFEDAVKQDLKSGNIADGYLLFGDDAYLKKLYADKLADRTAGLQSVFDLQRFSGDCDLQSVFDAVTQFPMMAERRYVELTDYDFERADKSDFDKLCRMLEELNDSCVLVLRFDSIELDLKKSAKTKKLITAMEKAGGKVVKLDHRKPAELCKMLTDGAKKRNCKMENAVAQYLIECVGSDISLLSNELQKLCSFTGEGAITKATVDEVCVKSVEASVYDLSLRIFNKDAAGALALLDHLFFLRIEPIIILSTVSSAYLDIYRVAAARKSNATFADVASTFGYKGREFVLERAARQIPKFDNKKFLKSFEALSEADHALKSFGGDERTILEKLIVELCFILAERQPL